MKISPFALSVCGVVAFASLFSASAMSMATTSTSETFSTFAPGPEQVVREGSGERRTKLTAMELQPFPSTAWDSLSEWAGGKPVSSADTNGKVVLICTYSDWYQPAQRAWATARKLAATHAKEGLVLIGAFHQDGWDAKRESEAVSSAEGKPGDKDTASIFVAHDAKGEFRKAILSDQDPDFYVIDRAGQTRFADITTESVEAAVKICLAETMDAASGIKSKLANDAANAEAEARKAGAIRSEVDLKSIPELTFVEPTADAYEKARWPKKDQDPSRRSDENGPKSLQLPPAGSYYKSDPKFKGRAIVVYVWSPDYRPSYEKIMPKMERLQRERGRDISVIGAMVRIEDTNNRNAKDTTPPGDLIKKFIDEQGIEHSQTAYADGMWVPYAVVASSNGVVRWEGSPNSDGFRAAIEQVLMADPGVKARREAEEAYIKKQKK